MNQTDLLQQGKYHELSELLLFDYLGNNKRLFERDDLNRRLRILETHIRDMYSDLCTTIGANVQDAQKATISSAKKFLPNLVPDEEMPVEAVPSEAEEDVSVPIYKIRVYPSDPTLEVLNERWKRGEIIVEEFQRGWVWSASQASKLIESFLAGLPVPPVFFYREESGKEIIIDGQQRLKTVAGFFNGRLPDGSPFYLRGVSKQWEGKNYNTLNESDKNRLRQSILRVIIVEQVDPLDTSSMYEVFSRLNTGGTALSPQEVRNASCHGPFNDMLKDLNMLDAWRAVFGPNLPDPRMRDIELIARFLALTDSDYTKPMKKFITDFMFRNRRLAENEKYKQKFIDTVTAVYEKLGIKPFHISRGINAAVYDSVMVAFSKHSDYPDDIRLRFNRLIKRKDFLETVSAHTTDEDTVRERIRIAEKVLFK
jgi:hypothetical protein